MPFFLFSAGIFAQPSCQSAHYDETVQLARVHDGDTLLLTDGRKVRVIGLNTPELARDKKPDEPYARQATRTLKRLLANKSTLRLRHGSEKHDRYKRLLAHVFLINGQNITQLMLQQGMGLAITIPPNLWGLDCYQQAEQQARRQKLGLWQDSRFAAIDATQLDHQSGFYRVQGTVRHIGESRHAYWLDMGPRFSLKIAKKDQFYFKILPIQQLQGQALIARGWIYPSHYKNKDVLRMQIRHPAMLDVVK